MPTESRPMMGEAEFQARIKYKPYEDVAPVFCNHIAIQATPDGFIVNLYAVTPPVMVGSPDEVREQARSLETVPAICVGRFLVPAGQLPSFAALLSTFAAAAQKPNAGV